LTPPYSLCDTLLIRSLEPMKKTLFLRRFFALWLILGLALPSPAFALRPEQSPKVKVGLEEALRGPTAGAEEKWPGWIDPERALALVKFVARFIRSAHQRKVEINAPVLQALSSGVPEFPKELLDQHEVDLDRAPVFFKVFPAILGDPTKGEGDLALRAIFVGTLVTVLEERWKTRGFPLEANREEQVSILLFELSSQTSPSLREAISGTMGKIPWKDQREITARLLDVLLAPSFPAAGAEEAGWNLILQGLKRQIKKDLQETLSAFPNSDVEFVTDSPMPSGHLVDGGKTYWFHFHANTPELRNGFLVELKASKKGKITGINRILVEASNAHAYQGIPRAVYVELRKLVEPAAWAKLRGSAWRFVKKNQRDLEEDMESGGKMDVLAEAVWKGAYAQFQPGASLQVGGIPEGNGIIRMNYYNSARQLVPLRFRRLDYAALSGGAGAEEIRLPEDFLAYQQALVDQMNREGVFQISMEEGGRIRRLVAPGFVYDGNITVPLGPFKMQSKKLVPLVLLAYRSDLGVLLLDLAARGFQVIAPDGKIKGVLQSGWRSGFDLGGKVSELLRNIGKGERIENFSIVETQRNKPDSTLSGSVELLFADQKQVKVLVLRDRWVISAIAPPGAGAEEMDLNAILADELGKWLSDLLKISQEKADQLAMEIIQHRPFQDWSQFRGKIKMVLTKEQITAIKESGSFFIGKAVRPPKAAAPVPRPGPVQSSKPALLELNTRQGLMPSRPRAAPRMLMTIDLDDLFNIASIKFIGQDDKPGFPGRGREVKTTEPPPIFQDAEQRRPVLDQLTNMIVQGYFSGPVNRGVDVGPMVAFIRRNIQSDFSPLVSDRLDESRYNLFVEQLKREVFSRFGELVAFLPTQSGIAVQRYRSEGVWEAVPYLDGRTTTWIAKGRSIQGHPGYADLDRAVYDTDLLRQLRLKDFETLTADQPKSIERQRLKQLLLQMKVAQNLELFLRYFSDAKARQEELRHTQAYGWARLFHGVDLQWHEFPAPLAVEAVIRQHSWLDQDYWTPAKLRLYQQKDASLLAQRAKVLIELEGQLQSNINVMEQMLNAADIPEADRDSWAYAYFLHYLILSRSSGFEQGYGKDLSDLVFGFFQKKGLLDDMVRVRELERTGLSGRPAPGQKALDLLKEFYDQVFMTDQRRLEMLTSAGAEEAVFLPMSPAELNSRLTVLLRQDFISSEVVPHMEGFIVTIKGKLAWSLLIRKEETAIYPVQMDLHTTEISPPEIVAPTMKALRAFYPRQELRVFVPDGAKETNALLRELGFSVGKIHRVPQGGKQIVSYEMVLPPSAGAEEKYQDLRKHTAPVIGVVYSQGAPDTQKSLLTVSANEVWVRERESGNPRFTKPITHDNDILIAAYRSQPRGVLVVGHRSAATYETSHGVRVLSPMVFDSPLDISAGEFYPGRLALSPGRTSLLAIENGSTEAVIRNLAPELKRPQIMARLQPLQGHPTSVAYRPISPSRRKDGQIAAIGTDEGNVEIWDVRSGHRPKRIAVLPEHAVGAKILSVAFTPVSGEKVLASADDQGEVRLWFAKGPRFESLRHVTQEKIYTLAFSPDGKLLASAGESGNIYLWDVGTAALRNIITGDSAVYSLAFSRNGKEIAAGRADKTGRIWKVPSAGAEESFRGELTVTPRLLNAATFPLFRTDTGIININRVRSVELSVGGQTVRRELSGGVTLPSVLREYDLKPGTRMVLFYGPDARVDPSTLGREKNPDAEGRLRVLADLMLYLKDHSGQVFLTEGVPAGQVVRILFSRDPAFKGRLQDSGITQEDFTRFLWGSKSVGMPLSSEDPRLRFSGLIFNFLQEAYSDQTSLDARSVSESISRFLEREQGPSLATWEEIPEPNRLQLIEEAKVLARLSAGAEEAVYQADPARFQLFPQGQTAFDTNGKPGELAYVNLGNAKTISDGSSKFYLVRLEAGTGMSVLPLDPTKFFRGTKEYFVTAPPPSAEAWNYAIPADEESGAVEFREAGARLLRTPNGLRVAWLGDSQPYGGVQWLKPLNYASEDRSAATVNDAEIERVLGMMEGYYRFPELEPSSGPLVSAILQGHLAGETGLKEASDSLIRIGSTLFTDPRAVAAILVSGWEAARHHLGLHGLAVVDGYLRSPAPRDDQELARWVTQELKSVRLDGPEFQKTGPQLTGIFMDARARLSEVLPPQAGAEEGRAKLNGFIQSMRTTIEALSPYDRLHPITPLTESFPGLKELLRDAGYEGFAESIWFNQLPSGPPISLKRRVFVERGTAWTGQVMDNLSGYFTLVDSPEEADLVVGTDRLEIKVDPLKQAFLQINADTAKAVTPGLLRHLQEQGLLNPGSVVVLHVLLKRVGDQDEDVLLFA